ncbi:MAG: hypothetical protein NTV72_02065 [Candidatus Taylorbacteria bacterium]|nr:hypothetical protein [Candidatus Taylorbacteria bacterium]
MKPFKRTDRNLRAAALELITSGGDAIHVQGKVTNTFLVKVGTAAEAKKTQAGATPIMNFEESGIKFVVFLS